MSSGHRCNVTEKTLIGDFNAKTPECDFCGTHNRNHGYLFLEYWQLTDGRYSSNLRMADRMISGGYERFTHETRATMFADLISGVAPSLYSNHKDTAEFYERARWRLFYQPASEWLPMNALETILAEHVELMRLPSSHGRRMDLAARILVGLTNAGFKITKEAL